MEDELEQKRRICRLCLEKGQELIQRGLDFWKMKMPDTYRQMEPSNIEFVAGARYLKRGRHCPSIIQDLYLANARRGRILYRVTEKTKYSHKYIFGPEGNLRIIETGKAECGIKTWEYLVYEIPDEVLGFTFDEGGALLALSWEKYTGGRLQGYLRASCFIDANGYLDFGIRQMVYEEYTHDEKGFAEVIICNVSPCIEDTACDREIEELVSFCKYRFIRKNGLLIGGIPEGCTGKLDFLIPKDANSGKLCEINGSAAFDLQP